MIKPNVTNSANDIDLSSFEEILRGKGAKLTKPRIAVMRCLTDATVSLSPREILEAITNDKTAPDIDQVSVYRILEAFLKFGLVHQVHPSGGFVSCTHIGCSAEFHVLVRCKICDKTEERDIPKEIFGPTQWYLRDKFGVTVEDQLIQVDGTCANCSNTERD